MQKQLNNAIRAKQLEVEGAQRHAEIVAAELRGMEQALRLFADVSPPSSPRVRSSAHVETGLKGRGPKGQWKMILEGVAKNFRGHEFSSSDVAAVASRLDVTVPLNAIRSQLHNYALSGVVRRVAVGRFVVASDDLRSIAELSNVPPVHGVATEIPVTDDV